MALSTLDMSRYAFLENELQMLNCQKQTLENKNLIAEYITFQIEELKIKKQKY